MPCLAAVAHLGLVPEHNDLLAPAILLRRGQHLCPVNNRLADRYLVAIGNKQYPVQFNITALGDTQMLHIQGLTCGYFMLLAASFNNSVNFEPPDEIL